MNTRNYEDYLPIIKQVVNNFCKRVKNITYVTTKDDLIQEMYFVYDKCDKDFDETRGTPFDKYLCTMCQHSLSKIFRENKKLLLIENIEDHENDIFAPDIMADNSSQVNEILECIKENQNSAILFDYFVKETSQENLAKKYQTNISKIKRIIRKFRREMKEIYNEV